MLFRVMHRMCAGTCHVSCSVYIRREEFSCIAQTPLGSFPCTVLLQTYLSETPTKSWLVFLHVHMHAAVVL